MEKDKKVTALYTVIVKDMSRLGRNYLQVQVLHGNAVPSKGCAFYRCQR